MFILSEMRTLVKVNPYKFNISHPLIVNYEICRRFCNKVLHNIGLCISLYDITKEGPCYIFPGEGSYHTPVEFRCIIFRPFVNEIIIGKVILSSYKGLKVSIGGFYNHVYINKDELQEPNIYDEKEGLWIWKYELEDGTVHDLYIEIGEIIKFKVIREEFNEQTPNEIKEINESTEMNKNVLYAIHGSIAEEGLGPLKWWN